MNSREKFIRDLGRLIQYAANNGIKILTYSLFRTAEEQNELFKKGLSNADGYDKLSKHQLGLACDLCIMDGNDCIWSMNKKYQILADYWKTLGNTWGGDFENTDFKDIYHFEV